MCKDCEVLYEKLQKQNHEMWQLRRRITRLQGQLKHERQEKMKLVVEKKKKRKQRYRNGKRGTKFNG